MATDISTQEKLYEGMRKVADAVGQTMGHSGNTVIIEDKFSSQPIVTNDGVTVAKSILLDDPVERMGAQLITQAALATNKEVGDGTTTSTVIANSMAQAIKSGINNGNNTELRDDIIVARDFALSQLKKYVTSIKTIEDVKRVATISAGNDEIGSIIADAFDAVGFNGVVAMEPNKVDAYTYLDVVSGMRYKRGAVSPKLLVDNLNRVMENPYLVIYEGDLDNQKAVADLMQKVADNKESLIIMADAFSSDVLTLITDVYGKGLLDVVAVLTPSFGRYRQDLVADLALATNVTLSKGNELTYGKVKRAIVGSEDTIIIPEPKDTEPRVNSLRALLRIERDEINKDNLKTRIGLLEGKIATVKVGAVTAIERKEKVYRAEDALNATYSAIEEGVVLGGGVTLAKVANDIMETKDVDPVFGTTILAEALLEPLMTMMRNTGAVVEVDSNKTTFVDETASVEDIIEAAVELDQIYYSPRNWKSVKELEVYDSAKVTRVAIENAASVALLLLSTTRVITQKKEK